MTPSLNAVAALVLWALPFAATMASFYAFILLFWSPQWEAVYAVALGVETLLLVTDEHFSSAMVFATHSLPAFLVAVTQSKGVAGASIVVWLVWAAANMHAKTGKSRIRFKGEWRKLIL